MAVVTPAVVKADSRPWVEKYRPQCIDDVVAHDDMRETLKRLMDSNAMPHLLFYGPPGTGKTTTIQTCARRLFGSRFKGNVLEMNASDDRGIDIVRNEIKDFASTGQVMFTQKAGSSGSIKLIVLDEADQMSHDAQAALRRVIERYTKNVRFCILCNHVNKIIPAVQSRCTRFRFSPVKKEQMLPRLLHIVKAEGIPFKEEGLVAAFKLSNGDMRRCLNTLQSAALAFGEVTEEAVYKATGNPTPTLVHSLVQLMVSVDFCDAWEGCRKDVHDNGISIVDLVREVHPYITRMDLPQDCKCFCLMKLADIEYALSAGSSEETALSGLVAAMQLVKESISTKRPIFALAASTGSVS